MRASLPWKVSISTVSPFSAAMPARNGSASSAEGYPPDIPPNETLVFVVDAVSID